MYCRQNKEPLKVDIVVIRKVMLPQHLEDGCNSEDTDEGEGYAGHVFMDVLEVQNRERGIYKISTNNNKFRCLWTCLVGHVVDYGFSIV